MGRFCDITSHAYRLMKRRGYHYMQCYNCDDVRQLTKEEEERLLPKITVSTKLPSPINIKPRSS